MRSARFLPAAVRAGAFLFALGLSARVQDAPEPVEIGAEAPTFELPATDGETFSLIVDYLGRYYFSEMGDTQRLW